MTLTKDDVLVPYDQYLHATGSYNSSLRYDNAIRQQLASKVADELQNIINEWDEMTETNNCLAEEVAWSKILKVIYTLRAKAK